MNYKNINDYEIMYLVAENNEDAYNVMLEKYHPLVDKYAKRYYEKYKKFGVEYDDLYQEGNIAITNAMREYDEDSDCLFYSFALLFIKREMERHVKSMTRLKHLLLTNAISINEEIKDSELNLENVLYNKKDNTESIVSINLALENLNKFKDTLTSQQSLIYELRVNGFNNKEISILLDLPYRSIDNSLRIVKEKLKNYENGIA